MLSKQILPLKKELLNLLLYDYLSQKKELIGLYNFFPDKNGFKNAIDLIRKNKYNREVLVTELTEQNKEVKNTSVLADKNTQLLLKENTFTVTTGHQLCLFTGPLYFVYKIFSTINLCEKLKEEFPENNFVPVYWMATEDHDFAEVNHFNVYGKQLEWKSEQKGAVGDFTTEGLTELQTSLKEILGNAPNVGNLISLFENAYIKHENLADATRFLVNELFGAYGLVVVDGNSKKLKETFTSVFEKDIFENVPHKKVIETISNLKDLKYESQVNPREINCFYLENNSRARIEKQGEGYSIVGTDKNFSKAELQTLIKTNPEKISPNVVLRPCYQQFILPNLVYVGGPGELAYWLEYRGMFDELGLFYPVLTPRHSITVIDSNTKQKISKLGLAVDDFSETEDVLIKKYLNKNNETKELNNYRAEIEKLYGKLNEEASVIDKTLSAAIEAEKQKALNSLANIEQKLNKAIKQRSETELNQIRSVKSKLFPENTQQERFDNFSTFYSKWGKDFLDFLKSNLKYDLVSFNRTVIEEN
ncbi:MAG TPA: bacillithiol biosynthesis cysteine-adding enzyme BshC [Bacteroidia bacterium]|jgi:bacillithiol biosynthesis cysteine-adding enzyme BshC|nr:bacillithiol biosynthesis cysteine-adding enzyme BshC [Bacteroidia bacterium]